MSAAPMDNLWNIDHKVLVEIVRQIEVDGEDFADTAAASERAGVDPNVGGRSVERLVRNGMLVGSSTLSGDWAIGQVTERGLRESGAWPTADQLAARVVSALNQTAEREPEPEKQSKLRGLATGLGGAGRDVLVDVMAAVVTKSAGLG